ncbi:MAG TPA: hypothetical protein DCP90_05555 [Clostridiales bacterium]|nr:hypothetical protein [Clostridiales bacterium]
MFRFNKTKESEESSTNIIKSKTSKMDYLLNILLIVGVVYIIGILSYPNIENYIEQRNRYEKGLQLVKEQKWDEADKYMLIGETALAYYVDAKISYAKKDVKEAIKSLDNISDRDYKNNEYFRNDIIGFKEKIEKEYEPYRKMEENMESYNKAMEKHREEDMKRWELRDKEPAIGMTASEARSSKWGSPKDINRTTTAYGVHEQWCYSGNKYIYLEDGIVTSIQD